MGCKQALQWLLARGLPTSAQHVNVIFFSGSSGEGDIYCRSIYVISAIAWRNISTARHRTKSLPSLLTGDTALFVADHLRVVPASEDEACPGCGAMEGDETATLARLAAETKVLGARQLSTVNGNKNGNTGYIENVCPGLMYCHD